MLVVKLPLDCSVKLRLGYGLDQENATTSSNFHDVELAPGHRALVGTGIAVAIPVGMVGLVHPRSGLAARVGLSIVNSPGTIDAGYRGEIKLSLINLDPAAPIVVNRGDRIAQLLVQRVELVDLVEVSSFDEAGLADTTRGDGGHGSSGGHASL